MLFRNFTPFPPLQFESRDEQKRDFGVVVLRGTFEIIPNASLRLVQEQAPLVMADEYHGEPGKSSLSFESSLAPFKSKTDLLVTADAYAPGGSAHQWTVGVQVGNSNKEFLVTGARQWVRGMMGWTLTDPQPASTVPIRYELAYGGTYEKDGELVIHEENPVGLGFVDPDTEGPVKAPQILPVGIEPQFGKPVRVEGLGPIPPGWLPRRDKAGTFNVIWEKTRWPDLPEDFSFDFYNTASAGLTLPGFCKGDETVKLTNLTPRGELSFQLPSFQLASLFRFEDGRIIPGPINLDTIHVDVPENRAYLTWRGVVPVQPPLRALEIRMKAPAEVIDHSSAIPAH